MLKRLMCLIWVATSLHSADISGQWKFELQSPGIAPGTPIFVFTQTGDALSGSYISKRMGSGPVSGMLKGSAIAFDIDTRRGRMHLVGTVTDSGRSMKGIYTIGRGNGSFSASKEAPKSTK